MREDELTGKTHECSRCKIPMVAVGLSTDWCKRCGRVWLALISTINDCEVSLAVAKNQAKKRSGKKEKTGG
jgi:hypothetical protein